MNKKARNDKHTFRDRAVHIALTERVKFWVEHQMRMSPDEVRRANEIFEKLRAKWQIDEESDE